MTSEPRRPDGTLDALTLRSPDALVAALPYLLGFPPRDSAVVLWIAGAHILLTQRIDLPPTSGHVPSWLSAVWSHPASGEADEIVLVVVSDHPEADLVVDAVVARAELCGLNVRDALRVQGDRWRSLLCRDPRCCPGEGRVVDPVVSAAVAAEFILVGRAPMPDRAAVEESLASDPEAVRARAKAIPQAQPTRGAGRRDREMWREESLALLGRALSAAGATAVTREAAADARILVALHDIRVRDTILWDLVHVEAAALDEALEVLSAILRGAPPGHAAPVATCCAIVAWLLGDGVRAGFAVERALQDDPGYSLAALVDASLRAGLPPTAWREAMAGLSRQECRYGAGARRATA